MRQARRPLLLLCALAGSTTLAGSLGWVREASAQDARRLDQVVVTATRSEEPVSAIPGSVIVIERAEIERQIQINGSMSNALSKLIPGYGLSNQTISEASETFRGRAFQVLVDGVSRNTPLRNVSRFLSAIDMNSVERIEVINGSSAAYGNGAAGGVINIITKKAGAKPEITASIGLRAFTADPGKSLAPEASVGYTGDLGPVDVAATLSGRQTRQAFDGDGNRMPSDAMLGQGGADDVASYNAMLKLGKSFGAKRVQLSANIVRLDQEPDYYSNYYARPYVAPDYTRPYDGRSVMENSRYFTGSYDDGDFALGKLNLTFGFNDIEKRFAASLYDPVYNNQVYYSGNPAAPTNSTLQGSTLFSQVLSAQATVTTPLDRLYNGLSLTWGADISHEKTSQRRGDEADIIAPAKQTASAGFAQLEAPVTDWFRLRGGLRHERIDVELDGFTRPVVYALNPATGRPTLLPASAVTGGESEYSATVYNLGAVFDVTPGVELFGGVSQGYSLPDWGAFTRRAGIALLGTTGNLALLTPKAQKVTTSEIGVRGTIGGVDATLSTYVSKSNEGLTFNPANNQITQSKERIWGVEATAKYDVTREVAIGAILGWQEGEYDSNGDGVIDRNLPNSRIATPFKATAFTDWQAAGDLRLRGEIVYAEGRDSHRDQLVLPDSLTFNAAASYRLGGGTASLGIENILDEDNLNAAGSATRNIPVASTGRLVVLRYTRTW